MSSSQDKFLVDLPEATNSTNALFYCEQDGESRKIQSSNITGNQNVFSTFAVSGQSNVVAESTADTLTLVAGTNVSITTDAATDSITINASGGSGTVTSVAVSGANGIGVSGSPVTSSGTIALSLGTITPASVAAVGTVTGSNLSGTNSGDETTSSIQSKLGAASASTDGYLTSTDWASFDSRLSSLPQGLDVGDSPTFQDLTLNGSLSVTSTISGSNFSGSSSGSNTGDQTITLTGVVTGSGTGSFATTIGNNQVTNGMLRQSAALSLIGNSTSSTGNVADISGTTDQVMRVTGAGTGIGFGSIDLSKSAAVGTSRLAYSNLAQGSALSVLGVAGNATANVASITAGADGNVLRRSGTTVGFGAIALGSGNAVTGALSGTNGGSGNSTWGGADRIPFALSTSALTNSANLKFNGTTFTLLGNESITRTTSTANEALPTTSTLTQTNSAADTGAAITRYNQRLITTDTGTYNNNSGVLQVLNLSSEITSSGATQGTTHTKAVSAGYFSASLTGTVTSGTSNRYVYALQGYAVGNTNGNSIAFGVVGDATGADTNWAAYFANGNVFIDNKLGVGNETNPTYDVQATGKIQAKGGIITADDSSASMSVNGEIATGNASGNPALFFQSAGTKYYILGTPA